MTFSSGLRRIQANIIEVHHTRTAGLRIIPVAETNSNRSYIGEIHALVGKSLQVDIPLCPGIYQGRIRIIMIDHGITIEGNIQCLSGVGWSTSKEDYQCVDSIGSPVAIGSKCKSSLGLANAVIVGHRQ